MEWLKVLFSDHSSVAYSVIVIGIVAALGHMLGSLKARGLGLGVAGVLFAGLIYAHFWQKPDEHLLHFVREFGLILFVYTIGVQVGPGFIGSLRRNGLKLNLLAASIVFLGVATMLTIYYVRMPKKELPYAVGLYSGAVTNTPSLASSQQALKSAKFMLGLSAEEQKKLVPGVSYAIAYPFGVLGIIIAMGVIRRVCKIDLETETKLLAAEGAKTSHLGTMNIEVTNRNLENVEVRDLPALKESGVVISRILHDGATFLPRGDTRVHVGDIIHVVGPAESIEDFRLATGAVSPIDLKKVPGKLTSKMILVTHSSVLGKSISELDPLARYDVTVTRIRRAEVELPVSSEVELMFGDSLMVVGEPEDIQEMSKEYGDSIKQLNHPHIIPIFIGIVLGVLVGSFPVNIPGVPAPVKLGLAGGPLLVAIILSRIGHIGPLVWYMPHSANMMVRELGITLFLACVGLLSGETFLETLKQYGASWLIYGALITIVPILIVGFVARLVFKMNYLTICGLLSGSMTDPPALAFAGAVTKSEAPSVAYATVYPLTMFLRVLSTQTVVLLIMG